MAKVQINQSPFEIALISKKKFHKQQRWLDDGSVVTFDIKQITSSNAEFTVNNNSNHIIWYSQLTELFFNINDMSLNTGEIFHKNGNVSATRDMDVDSFVNFVKGKRFKVLVNTDGKVAKVDKDFCEGMSYEYIHDTVKNLLEQNKYTEAAKYLIPSTQYSLQEF